MRSDRTNILVPNLVIFCICIAISVPIFINEIDGYTVAETLMNYQFGFYRRALLGNLFMWPGNSRDITLLTKFAYTICLCTPLFITAQLTRNLHRVYRIALLVIVFFSPFGVLFYLKEFASMRKELFFYPFFLLFLQFRPTSDTAKLILGFLFILICSLIHESFFFLFLPFFLGYLYLNDILPLKQVGILFALSVLLLVTLSTVVKGNSIAVTEKFIDQFIALGFERKIFQYFYYYQKFSFKENLAVALKHYEPSIVAIYNVFYLIQFPFFLLLARHYRVYLKFKNPKALMITLVLIWFHIFLLCFIAMDYGRWFSLGFITSIVLAGTQIIRPEKGFGRSLKFFDYLLLLVLLLLAITTYIPFWTYERTFVLQSWIWRGPSDLYHFLYRFGERVYHHFFGY